MGKFTVILSLLFIIAFGVLGCGKTYKSLTASDVQKGFEQNNLRLTKIEPEKNDPILFGLNNENITLYDSFQGKIYIIYFNSREERLLGEKKLENMEAVGLKLNEYKKYELKNLLIIASSNNELEKVIKKLE